MLNVLPLPGHFSIRLITKAAPLRAETEKLVEAIWQREKTAKGEKLFNGPVVSFVRFEQGFLEVRLADYRTLLAQMREGKLFGELQIRPLAVSGLVTLGSKVVFGRRAEHLNQHPGKWELVPSGGVTPSADGEVSIDNQFLLELEEELGLSRTAVSWITPFTLIEDTVSHVIDVGVEATVSDRGSGIESSRPRTDEYSEIRWIEKTKLARFCDSVLPEPGVVDVSLAILKAKHLI